MRKLFVIWAGVNLAINKVEADFNSSGSALDNIQWNGPSPLSGDPVQVPQAPVRPEFDDKVYSDEEVIDLSQVKSKGNSSWNGCESPESVGFCYDNYSGGVPDTSALEQCMSDHDCCPGDSPTGYADCHSSASDSLPDYAIFSIAEGSALLVSAMAQAAAYCRGAGDSCKRAMWTAIATFAVGTLGAGIALSQKGSAPVTVPPALGILGASIAVGGLTYWRLKSAPGDGFAGGGAAQPLLQVQAGGRNICSFC